MSSARSPPEQTQIGPKRLPAIGSATGLDASTAEEHQPLIEALGALDVTAALVPSSRVHSLIDLRLDDGAQLVPAEVTTKNLRCTQARGRSLSASRTRMPHWDWTTAAGPPGSRISALATAAAAEQEPPVVPPAPDEPVRYEKHIKTLFRARDRQSMRFGFDLWSYDDVRTHADAILERVRNGTMPCDGAWPAEKVDTFQRWVSTGTPA